MEGWDRELLECFERIEEDDNQSGLMLGFAGCWVLGAGELGAGGVGGGVCCSRSGLAAPRLKEPVGSLESGASGGSISDQRRPYASMPASAFSPAFELVA